MRDPRIGTEAIAVDEQQLGAQHELVDSSVHGCDRGLQDVQLVDLLGAADAYPPAQRLSLDDGAKELALALGELLGVVEQRVGEALGQDDRSGHYGPSQATPPRLIAAALHEPQWGEVRAEYLALLASVSHSP